MDTTNGSPEAEVFRIDHYRILEKLGEGGMGLVYKARDTRPGRGEVVALKVVLGLEDLDPSRRELAVRRFHEEANALRACLEPDGSIHPNIVRYLRFSEEAGGPLYITTEFVEGVTLKTLLAAHQERVLGKPVREGASAGASVGLPAPLALEIGRQVAGALAALHRIPMAHRDLKLKNVMTTRSAAQVLAGEEVEIKLVDFGIALRDPGLRGQMTEAGLFVGTPDFAAPEQLKSYEDMASGVSPASDTTRWRDPRDAQPGDLFSLGLLLYYLLEGRHLRCLPQLRLGDGDRARRETLLAALERGLEQFRTAPPESVKRSNTFDLLESLLSTAPDARPTAEEVERTLSSILEPRGDGLEALTGSGWRDETWDSAPAGRDSAGQRSGGHVLSPVHATLVPRGTVGNTTGTTARTADAGHAVVSGTGRGLSGNQPRPPGRSGLPARLWPALPFALVFVALTLWKGGSIDWSCGSATPLPSPAPSVTPEGTPRSPTPATTATPAPRSLLPPPATITIPGPAPVTTATPAPRPPAPATAATPAPRPPPSATAATPAPRPPATPLLEDMFEAAAKKLPWPVRETAVAPSDSQLTGKVWLFHLQGCGPVAVKAVFDGTVARIDPPRVFEGENYGACITLDHGKTHATMLCGRSLRVKLEPGAQVRQGEEIGEAGTESMLRFWVLLRTGEDRTEPLTVAPWMSRDTPRRTGDAALLADEEFQSCRKKLPWPVEKENLRQVTQDLEGGSLDFKIGERGAKVKAVARGRVTHVRQEVSKNGLAVGACLSVRHAPSFSSRICGLLPTSLPREGAAVRPGDVVGEAGPNGTLVFWLRRDSGTENGTGEAGRSPDGTSETGRSLEDPGEWLRPRGGGDPR